MAGTRNSMKVTKRQNQHRRQPRAAQKAEKGGKSEGKWRERARRHRQLEKQVGREGKQVLKKIEIDDKIKKEENNQQVGVDMTKQNDRPSSTTQHRGEQDKVKERKGFTKAPTIPHTTTHPSIRASGTRKKRNNMHVRQHHGL